MERGGRGQGRGGEGGIRHAASDSEFWRRKSLKLLLLFSTLPLRRILVHTLRLALCSACVFPLGPASAGDPARWRESSFELVPRTCPPASAPLARYSPFRRLESSTLSFIPSPRFKSNIGETMLEFPSPPQDQGELLPPPAQQGSPLISDDSFQISSRLGGSSHRVSVPFVPTLDLSTYSTARPRPLRLLFALSTFHLENLALSRRSAAADGDEPISRGVTPFRSWSLSLPLQSIQSSQL